MRKEETCFAFFSPKKGWSVFTNVGRGFKPSGTSEFCGTKVFCRSPLTEIKLEWGVLNQVVFFSEYVKQSENVAADDDKNDDNHIKSLACSNTYLS